MTTLFNTYVWELYVNSVEGQEALNYFAGVGDFAMRAQHGGFGLGVWNWVNAQDPDAGVVWQDEAMDEATAQLVTAVRDFAAKQSVNSPEQIRQLLTALIGYEVPFHDGLEDTLELDFGTLFENLPFISLGLHVAAPEVFVPYAFSDRHDWLLRIAAEFGIPLPPVAGKNDFLGRWLFYANFCGSFQEFRRTNGLTVPELLAFMYDFAIHYSAASEEADLPAPRHAWLLVGGGEKNGDFGFLEEADGEATSHWQGSLDMRRGDVCVMYVRRPVSSVHSVCRVMVDAYEDPFFHYKHTVRVGQFQRLTRLHFRELAADPVMADSQHIRRNLQGMSGQMLNRAEYERLLHLLEQKGQPLSEVPRLPKQTVVDLSDLATERDVERLLVEPLLLRLGFRQEDWIRQLPVRMGRGERVYPDYALGVTGQAPEVRAHALVEVKYRAAGERAWREAFLQAKSYGLRLGAGFLLVAAAEGVRFYPRIQDDFRFERGQFFAWNDLQEGSSLLTLTQALRPGRRR